MFIPFPCFAQNTPSLLDAALSSLDCGCMQVLKPVAAATSKVRALKGLSLKESVSQFSSTMTAQADLRVECAHLRRFYNNFASVSQSVTPPYPFPGCETAEVLIETFEPGEGCIGNLQGHCKIPFGNSWHALMSCSADYIPL